MFKKVLQYIQENQMFQLGDSVILGVSGGADSICMLYVLKELSKQMNLKLIAVHVNHHIRGQEADDDMMFVENLCRKEKIPCEIFHIDVRQEAKNRGMSEEEAGRDCRYESFYKAYKKYGANKIAVAHNLNDNSETILFHLFRGTGIKGMTGIPVKREAIVRPLLCVTRKEIEAYLSEMNVRYQTDKTNYETEYSRNKLRLELIPYIKENINQRAEYNIVNAAEMFTEIEAYLEEETNHAFQRYVRKENGSLKIERKAYERLHPAIMKRVIRKGIEECTGRLKDVTSTHIENVLHLGKQEVSKEVHLPYGLVAIATYDGVEIRKKVEEEKATFVEVKLMEKGNITFERSAFPQMMLTMQAKENLELPIPELRYTKWFDCDRMDTLTLRNRQKGDYLIIDEKGSRKKLKDFFINEKIPAKERDNILLLADGSHIVWVVGYRISSYYKITNETKNVLRIDYNQPASEKESDIE